MDIFSHALAGAATGATFGRPLLGATFAVLPDLVLGIKRVDKPSKVYILTHSLLFVGVVWLILYLYIGQVEACCSALALISHIALDIPTHGSAWAPRLFYPFSDHPFSMSCEGEEWEWFNHVWLDGFFLTIAWIYVCLSIILPL